MAVTENVTVLFTDMVASTELASRLSPDSADELRHRHFSILRRAIAETGGTEVKTLGDGVMAVFSATSAALSCAVAMQQAVERDNRASEDRVGLRVGLSGGEVTREAGDYFGDPVVEASRLCARAQGGQILTSALVPAMAGRRTRHPFRPLGEVELRGLPYPVATCEVGWEPAEEARAATGGVPLPWRLALRPGVGLVGRGVELDALASAYKRVASGTGRELLLVCGEAGSGKTALVAEAARTAFDNRACVLLGRCEEELTAPYQLFAEAIGHYVAHADEQSLLTYVAEQGSELGRLVPVLGQRIPDLPPSTATDPDTERYLLFAAVVGLLAAASRQQPVVCILDDLQWADKGSLHLLRHVAASDLHMRVLVVGVYRDTELARSHPLFETLGALRACRGVGCIELGGLDDAGVVSFMESAAGHALDDAGVGLARAVHHETDGNPFFVEELLRHLSETGVIFQDTTGRWVASDEARDVGLPNSVRQVIRGRVVRLGTAVERTLSFASVIGRDFDLEVLGLATRSTEDELLEVLDAASAAALVRELADAPGQYSFAHALIQHTLYEDLGPTRRARVHRQVAEALERARGGRPAARVRELARHWLGAATPEGRAKALDYARRAADAALDALAPGDALHYYGEALDLYQQTDEPEPALGVDLRIGLGTAQRQTGDPAYRDTLLDAARRAADLSDTTRLVAAALANERGFYSSAGVIDAERTTVLEAALARLPTRHPDRALVLAHLCSELAFGSLLERRSAIAEEAIGIARASGDDATIVRVLVHVFDALFVPPMLAQSLSRSAEALARAERAGDPVLSWWATHQRAMAAGGAGDIDELDRCIALEGALGAPLNQPTLSWVHTFGRAARALIAGDPDRAEQLALEARRIGTGCGEPDAIAFSHAQLMNVSFQRGTMGELVPLIERVVASNPGVPAFVGALAWAHVEAGRVDPARRLLEQFADSGFDLPLDPAWLAGMTVYARVAVECGDARHAEPLLERLAPWAGQFAYNSATTEGPVSLYLGGLATVVGRYEEAQAYFAQSEAFSEKAGAAFFTAWNDLWWGRMLAERRATGDAVRSRELLDRARDKALTHGYASVARRAADVLGRVA